MQLAFHRLDLSGDGYVSREECAFAVGNLAKNITEEEIKLFFEYVDVDNSGSLDWMEFKVLFDILSNSEEMASLPAATQRALRKVKLFICEQYSTVQ